MANIKNILITIKELIAKQNPQKTLDVKLPESEQIDVRGQPQIVVKIPDPKVQVNVNIDAKGISKRPQFFLRLTDIATFQDFLNTFETLPDYQNLEAFIQLTEQQMFDVNKSFIDIPLTSDLINLEFTAIRDFIDNAQLSDSARSMLVEKLFNDSYSTSDLVSLHPNKVLLSNAELLDSHLFAISPYKVDPAIISETRTFNVLKYLVDTTALYDVLNEQIIGDDSLGQVTSTDLDDIFEKQWDALRSQLENVISTDLLSMSFNKSLQDFVSLGEFTSFISDSDLSEFTSFQEFPSLSVGKLLSEGIDAQDIFNLNLFKLLLEEIQPEDYPLIEVGKNPLDYSSILESVSYDIAKRLNDYVFISEQFTPQAQGQDNVNASNNATMSDIAAFIWDAYRSYLEGVFSTDIVNKTIGKVAIENTVLSEEILTYLDSVRQFEDPLLTDEVFSLLNSIYKQEALNLIDDVQKQVAKALLEDVSISELVSRTIQKIASDEVYVDQTVAKDVSKILLDVLDIYEMFDPSLQGQDLSSYSNTANLLDYIYFVLAIQRTHLDTVSTNDIVENIVLKLLSEELLVNDSMLFSIDPSFLENLSTAENIQKLLTKFASEEVSVQDALLKAITKSQSEQATVEEFLNKNIGKNPLDILDFDELNEKIVYKVLIDTLDAYDVFDSQVEGLDSVTTSSNLDLTDVISFIIGVYRDFLETSITADTFELLVNKFLVDNITPQEALIKALSIIRVDELTVEEYVALSSSKSITDLLETQESVSKFLARNFTDTLSITDYFDALIPSEDTLLEDMTGIVDSGSLLLQNYAEHGYFLEDYVGDKYTF
jgi:hypothetical protein